MVKEKPTGSELVLGVKPNGFSIGKRRSRGEFIEAEVYVVEPLSQQRHTPHIRQKDDRSHILTFLLQAL